MKHLFRKHLAVFFLLTIVLLAPVNMLAQKRVCITVDDLPVVDYGMNSNEEWTSLTQKLIDTFKAFDIPAIGYVNERKLYSNGQASNEKVAVLEMWLTNGYELGNHTFSHMDYHKSTLKDFSADLNRGEIITRPLMDKYGKSLQYFRHPYLRAGNSQETSEALEELLREKDYIPAPVTLDSDDYIFAKAYAGAVRQGKKELMEKIGNEYVSHTENKLHYYEKLSNAVFGRNIDHTYLMHANLLNADYLDKLAAMFERNGYNFVSQTEVLKDKAYSEPVTKFGNWGVSWLYRWALSREQGKALFRQDIEVPEYIRELAK